MRRSVALLSISAVVVAGAAAVTVAAAPGAAAATSPVSGRAFGFGYNANGQLGTGSTSTGANPTPTAAQSPPVAGEDAYRSVAVGYNHTVAIGSNGDVFAWGDNTFGELGIGTTTPSTVPVTVSLPAGTTAVAVAAGYYDSFAVLDSGQVYAWGYNGQGQLGIGGTATQKLPARVSVPTSATGTPKTVSAGYAHTELLMSDGVVYGWGLNNVGQVGDGTLATRTAPVLVRLPAGSVATSVSAGYAHTLAATSTGAVYAWGYNASGQLGIGTTTNSPLPVAVDVGASGATSVSAGYQHSLAVLGDGSAKSWGDNSFGELGTGQSAAALPKSTTPVTVVLGSAQASAVGAGYQYSLLQTATGGVLGFGDNTYGELGTGNAVSTATPVATKLPAGAVVSSIATQGYSLTSFVVLPPITTTVSMVSSQNPSAPGHAITLTAIVTPTDGGALTFAGGGAPLPGCSALPLVKIGPATYGVTCSVSALPVGTNVVTANYLGDATYAPGSGTLSGGQVVTAVDGVATGWGYNASGQLGIGNTATRTAPVATGFPVGTTVVQLAGDNVHSLAILSDGTVWAWGDNTYGELGTGTMTSSKVPVQVQLPSGVVPVTVSAGSYDSFLLAGSGAIYAWGRNNYGQLGDGTTSTRSLPQAVQLPSGVAASAVSAGLGHTLALASTGAVYAWGLNNVGQLGIGSTTNTPTPTVVPLPNGALAAAVSAGYAHSLVATTGGKVFAWGDNSYGALGNGTVAGKQSPVAVTLPSGTSVTAVSAGYLDSAALASDGTVLTWGYNNYGELGNGTTTTQLTAAPAALPSGVVITSLVADDASMTALASDGTVYAWGDNSFGELGTGGTTTSATPVLVRLPAGGYATAIGGGGYALSSFAIVPRIASATSVASAPNPSTYGQSVTITAMVAPTDNGGAVRFTSDGTTIAGCATVSVTAGQAVCATTALEPGTRAISAQYSGDALYLPSSGNLDGGQTVTKIGTTTSVSTSVNPGTYGSPITFTATVTGSDNGGSVAFLADGTVITGCDAQAIGSSGTATCTTSALSGGMHSLEADYSGDAHYAGSSGTLSGGQVVKITTTTTASPVKILNLLKKPVYKATLINTVDGTPIAGETIGFYADAVGGALQCSAVTDSSGVATCTGPLLVSLGTYHAKYDGSALYYGSTGYSNISIG